MNASILPATGFRISLLVFLSSRAGVICKPIFTIAVALLFAWLSGLHPFIAAELGNINQPVLVGALVLFMGDWLSGWTIRHLTTGVKIIQTSINRKMPINGQIDVDGVAAAQTLDRLALQMPLVSQPRDREGEDYDG